jgi:hypothetical protein
VGVGPAQAPVDGLAGSTSAPTALATSSARTWFGTPTERDTLTASAPCSIIGRGVSNARRLERPWRVRTATFSGPWNTRCGALEDGHPPPSVRRSLPRETTKS